LQDLRARRVETLDTAGVNYPRITAAAGPARLLELLAQPANAEHRPRAANLQNRCSGTFDIADRGLGLGHRED
jgi:hypothetical protein